MLYGPRFFLDTKYILYPTFVTLINGHLFSFGVIVQETELVQKVLGDLACVTHFNVIVIHNPKHLIILSLSCRKQETPHLALSILKSNA